MLECILIHLKARQIIRVINRVHKLGYYDEIRIPVPYLDKDKLVKVIKRKKGNQSWRVKAIYNKENFDNLMVVDWIVITRFSLNNPFK